MPSKNFQTTADAVKKLKEKPTQDELLLLYAYYKQATQDPAFNAASKPGMFDFKGKYKYEAWEKVNKEGVTAKQAEEKYIELVEELKKKHGYDASKQPEAVGAA